MSRHGKPGAADKERLHVFQSVLSDLVDEAIEKARSGRLDKDSPAKKQPSSFFINPYDYLHTAAGKWQERPSRIEYGTLRNIAIKNPVVAAIHNTRINQVASFSSPSRLMELSGNPQVGFKIIHKDPEHKLTAGEKGFVRKLEDFIQYCGVSTPATVYDRDDFDVWLRKSVRDSLTLDAVATELIPTRNKNSVAEFYCVDAATIRFAKIRQEMTDEDETAFVQILNGQIVTEFRPDEMFYGIRNPTSSIENACYGMSEIEQLISVVTSIFNAMAHNSAFFKKGMAARGILNFKLNENGDGIPDVQFESFKRAFEMMTAGTNNAWKIPMVQAHDLEFVNLGGNNREMEFSLYLDFLTRLACAIYLIDPAEISFKQANTSGGGNVVFESAEQQRLTASKDRGLRALLIAFQRWINHFIIARVAPEFFFCWDGLELKTEEEVISIRKQKVEAYCTLDEIREEAGLKALGPDKGGDMVLNPQYVQIMQQKQMMAMQQGAAGGSEDEGPSPQLSDEETRGQIESKDDEEDDRANDNVDKQEEEQEETRKSFLSPLRDRKFIEITLED